MTRTRMTNPLVKALLLLLLTTAATVSWPQSSQQDVADRLANLDKLLNRSSGARQVIDSGSSEAQAKRQQALDRYRQARHEVARGDNQAAAVLMNQATRLMFEAMRISAPASMSVDHEVATFGQRRESVVALHDALNRISDETGETESRTRVNRQLKELVERADELLRQGSNDAARIEIDKAYHLLKVSIESIRSGQTLVRSLRFDSKEEEYRYEIDRNDTHDMLVGLLIGDRMQSDELRQKIAAYVAEGRRLRRQAEAYADGEAHQQAIDLLEQSTRQLVRAIRSAGIYIPG